MPEFRARINAYADDVLEPDQLRPRLRIDGPLHLKAITHDLVRGLDSMGPFGLANPRPVFHAGPVEIVDGPRSIKDRHLKMTFNQDGRRFRAIAWRAAERAAVPRTAPRRRQPRVLARPERVPGRDLSRALRRGLQEPRRRRIEELGCGHCRSLTLLMRWQKAARLAIAVFIVAFAGRRLPRAAEDRTVLRPGRSACRSTTRR